MTTFFNCTVGGLLEEIAQKHPDRDALVYSDRDLKYSYKELNAKESGLSKSNSTTHFSWYRGQRLRENREYNSISLMFSLMPALLRTALRTMPL